MNMWVAHILRTGMLDWTHGVFAHDRTSNWLMDNKLIPLAPFHTRRADDRDYRP